MSDLERFVRPPFGSNGSEVGTLDPFDQYADLSYGPTVLHIDDSLSVVSIDGPPSMTDDDDDATGAVFRREGGALQNDDDDVDSEILSWMASPDFDIDESHNTNNNAFAAAGGSNDDERSNIEAPQEHDVRFGRGPDSNSHPGNVWFRDRVEERKAMYRGSNNATKTRIAQEVVQLVRTRQPPGRFLVRDLHSGLWNDVGAAEAHKKAKQALREPPRGASTREVVVDHDVAASAVLPVAAVPEAVDDVPDRQRGLPLDDYQPVYASHPHDFLLGRGGSSNRQPGNLRLRERAAQIRHRYQAMRNSQKATFANEIFQAWRNETTPPGRFLKRVDGILYEVPDGEAIRTIQVLMCREPSSPTSRRPTVPPPGAIHVAEYPLPHPPPPTESSGAQVPVAPRSRFADAAQPEFMSSKRRTTLRLSRNVLPGTRASVQSAYRAAPAPIDASSSLTGGTESTESSASSGHGGGPADSSAANSRGRTVARLTSRVKAFIQRLFCGSLVRSDV